MLGLDGKPKQGGPQKLTSTQVLQPRAAAQREKRTVESTQPPAKMSDLTTPLPSEDVPKVTPKIPKKKSTAKSGKGGAGGQDTVADSAETAARASRRRPPKT
jgi:hypothetical protein